MKKNLIALSVLLLISTAANAIHNGTPLERVDHQNIVSINERSCTASLINPYVFITAAHCESTISHGYGDVRGTGKDVRVTDYSVHTGFINHETDKENGMMGKNDIMVFKTDFPVISNKSSSIALEKLEADDTVHLRAFGGGIFSYLSGFIKNTDWGNGWGVTDVYGITTDGFNDGTYIINGDSGAPYFDDNGHQVAINVGEGNATFTNSLAVKIHSHLDFIRSEGEKFSKSGLLFSYPAEVKPGETFDIQLISDRTIEHPICGTMFAMDTCTIDAPHHDTEITIWGEGDTAEVVRVREESIKCEIDPSTPCKLDPVEPEDPDNTGEEGITEIPITDITDIIPDDKTGDDNSGNNSSNGGGGSMGLLTLLGLGLAAMRRRY